MTSTRAAPSALRGAAASLAGLGAAELMATTAGTSLIDGVGRLVVDSGPRQLVDAVVHAVGTKDKPVIRAAVGAGVVGAGALLARQPPARRDATMAVVAAAGAAAALRRPPRRPLPTAIAVGTGTMISRQVLRARPRGRTAAGLLVVGAASIATSRRQRHRQIRSWDAGRRGLTGGTPVVHDGAEAWPNVTPLITSVDDFYITDVNLEPPLESPGRWRLAIHGLVERPMDVSLADLSALPQHDLCAAMVCIHNPVGGHRVGNGTWRGVRLADVVKLANVSATATAVVTEAVDGYRITLPLELVSDELPAYVITHMNGAPLPAAHGGPVRVFTPGLYGQYTGAKWLAALELTNEPRPDYWTSRGWPQQPMRVRPTARIDHPRDGSRHEPHVELTGVAWAPPDGLADVEVRADADRWRPAEMARDVSPLSWRRWRASLSLDPGLHRIQARAVPRTGAPQDAVVRPPFPTGATGLHTIQVRTPSRGPRHSHP